MWNRRASQHGFTPYRPAVAVAVLGVLLFAGGASLLGAPGTISAAAASLVSDGLDAAQQLALASASLADGQGPAAGQSLTCSVANTAVSETCSAATAAAGMVNTTAFWNEELAPGARSGAATTYDGKDRVVVMFGGDNSTAGYLADTWEFIHSQWINLPEATHPSSRSNASIAYDANPKDKYVVLFGGENSSGFLGDTWKFVNGTWTALSPASHPSARSGAALTWDPQTNSLILFGGETATGAVGDTWSFSGGNWSPLSPASSPSPRWGAGAAFDVVDNYLVLFGGFDGSQYFGDTWEYSSGLWTKFTSLSTSPAPRVGALVAYDPYVKDNYTVLFGGVSKVGAYWADFSDTWEFVHNSWTQLYPAAAPEARDGAAFAYDGSDNEIMLFSGNTGGDPVTSQDSWVYSYNNTTLQTGWNQVLQESENQIENPSARWGAAMVPDAGTENGDLLFGGSTVFGPNNQTWQFTTPGQKKNNFWIQEFPKVAPSARSYAAMTYDSADGYVLLFGGMNRTGAALGDTWEYSSATAKWTQVFPAMFPAARYGAGMAYDPVNGYVVLFGGTNGAKYFNDTWTYAGGVWTQLPQSSKSPNGVAFAGLAWNPAKNYVLLYGGTTGGSASGNVYSFISGGWTQLHPKGAAPPPTWGMIFTSDPKDNYTYMFGGCTAMSFNPLSPTCPSADVMNTTWKFKGNFTQIVPVSHNEAPPIGLPSGRYLASGAFWYPIPNSKTLDEYTVIQNGLGANGKPIQERWGYVANIYSLWYPDPVPVPRYGAITTQDVRDQQSLMFGGIGPVAGGGLGYLNDTWMWDTGVWGATHSVPTNPSPRAFGISASWYPNLPKFQQECLSTCFTIMFGGVGPVKDAPGSNGYLGDTWKWSGSPWGGQWRMIASGGGPSPRANASMVFDNATQYILLFGGQNANQVFNDTWKWTPTFGWQQIPTNVAPPPMEGQEMAYDNEDGYVVLFGGRDGSTYYNQTWKYTSSGWSIIPEAVHPSGRVGGGFMDSPLKAGWGFVLFEGGYSPSGCSKTGGYCGDSWEFVHNAWYPLPTRTATFVPVAWASVADDWDDGHPNMFSGMTAGGISDDFWEFKHGS